MPDLIPAIDLQNVSKVYRGRVHALNGIDLRVDRGEIFGLLGPNGAGKSTLVKIMMSIVRPTRATGTILGEPVGHKPTLARVGYLPENHRFPRYLTGRQTLDFFGALSNVDRAARKRRSGELLSTVGMEAAADRKIATYSKGMMQRIGIAQALMSDPDLVVLDEPTDGVDPVGRRDIRDVLRSLRERGKTVFVNSHLLVELELFCDRIAILVGGRVARQGTLDEMTLAQQRYEIEIAIDDPARARDVTLVALRPLLDSSASQKVAPLLPPVAPAAPLPSIHVARLQSGQRIELIGPVIRIATLDAAIVQPAIDALRAAQITVRRVQVVKPTLEDLFLDIVRPGEGKASDPTLSYLAPPTPPAGGLG